MLDTIGYDDDYLGMRTEIDLLCDDITSGAIAQNDAWRQYEVIERSFYQRDPERIELFRMIYKNRIERLCRQFLLEETHGN